MEEIAKIGDVAPDLPGRGQLGPMLFQLPRGVLVRGGKLVFLAAERVDPGREVGLAEIAVLLRVVELRQALAHISQFALDGLQLRVDLGCHRVNLCGTEGGVEPSNETEPKRFWAGA